MKILAGRHEYFRYKKPAVATWAMLITIIYKQGAQLSQTGRAMLRVIEYFTDSLNVTQSHWKWYHSKAVIRFLFAFHGNYGPILYHFRDKARYWSKIEIFHTPCIRRRRPCKYCYKVWCGKTRMVWLQTLKKVWEYVYSFWHNTWTWRTAGRTDGQTDTGRWHRPRLCVASWGKYWSDAKCFNVLNDVYICCEELRNLSKKIHFKASNESIGWREMCFL